MINIIENIKTYFSEKDKGEKTEPSPAGMCPTCWGYNEWDGQYYKVIKDKHIKPEDDIYSSFIRKIVDKHVGSTHQHKDKYICTTCDKDIK